MEQGPKLLIDWEPRGRAFLRAIRPAFSFSGRRLKLEIHRSPRSRGAMTLSYFIHAAIFAGIAFGPVREQLQSQRFIEPVAFHPEHYEIVYVPSHALPQMNDAGGAASGSTGASGGAALHTSEQVIRIARGNPIIPHVVDTPRLSLPRTDLPANLLVSSSAAPSVPANAIQHERIMTVQAFASTSAVAPVPQIVRERISAAPTLPVTPVPPPVSTARNSLAGSKLELPTPTAPPPEKATRSDAATLAAIRAGVPPPDVKVVDVGSLAPPTKDSAVVISSQPGPSVGKPATQSAGAIAMSPTGAGKSGVGEGLGSGAANGASAGASSSGKGTGTNQGGTALGDGAARAGITPNAGPGGSGNGMIATNVPGVTISNGSVTIPSFGPTTAAKAGNTRFPKDERNARPITVVATASAGGAVSARGLLKGERVYTIYIDTTAGLAFLQYSEHGSADGIHDLTAPEPLVSDVPAALRSARVLLAGLLDRNGSLRDIHVLDAASQDTARQLIDAIQRWHFRPALRGDAPVEVDAIFGLNVGTK